MEFRRSKRIFIEIARNKIEALVVERLPKEIVPSNVFAMQGAIYQHTQPGHTLNWILRACLMILLGVVVLLGARDGFRQIALHWAGATGFFIIALGLLFSLVAFRSLTVTADDEQIELWFGPGWIRRKFALADIESCRPVRNSILLGWGIRWFPGCWTFNVSGLQAVELKMKDGKRFRIGTDEPILLCEAITSRLAPRQ